MQEKVAFRLPKYISVFQYFRIGGFERSGTIHEIGLCPAFIFRRVLVCHAARTIIILPLDTVRNASTCTQQVRKLLTQFRT